MEFPNEILVSNLDIQNRNYDLKQIIVSEALYFGGSKFEAVKNTLLTPRPYETQGVGGRKMREARLNSCYYGAPVAGFIDFLAACVFQSNPTILFKGPDDRLKYYNQINDSVATALHSRLIQLILHGQGILSLTETTNSADEMKPVVCGIDYESVIDWDRDSSGNIVWIKTKSIDLVRENPWEEPSIERNTWTFLCADGIYEYSADREIVDGKPKAWDKKAVGLLVVDETTPGIEAVTEIVLPNNFCLMDSVSRLVIGLLNREASIDFALDNSAFAFLCLFTKKNLKKVVVSEFQGLTLNPGEDAKWLSPEGTNFQALQDRAEQMRKQLENRIQSAALNLASRDTQGRASGIAKYRDFGPIAILLAFYGEVLKSAITEHIEKLIALKGDTGKVTFEVKGLDEFDIASLDTKLDLAARFFLLPAGKTAKKFVLNDVEQAFMGNARPEVREQAIKENEAAVIPDMQPAAPTRVFDNKENETK